MVHNFLIPLSKGKKAAITFEALPVTEKDIEMIRKWLDLFADALIEPAETKQHRVVIHQLGRVLMSFKK